MTDIVERLQAEIERLRDRAELAEKLAQARDIQIERLRAEAKAKSAGEEKAIQEIAARHAELEAEIEPLRAAVKQADVLRARWLNDGHGLRGQGLADFKAARDAYDQARRAMEEK